MRGEGDPYRELFERSADAILVIEDGEFVDCNRAAVEMLRCGSREQVLQTHPSAVSPPTQPDGRSSYEKANEMIAIALERGSHRFEWLHRRADGETFPVEVLLTALERDQKRVLHVVWRDITERKSLEAQLRQAQKLETIGKLVGGVAHDFNNMLVAILGNSELLRARLEEPELLEHVDEIHHAGTRAAALVRRLLAFTRKQEVAPRLVDLNEVLGECDRMLRRMIGEDVALDMRPAKEPLVVRADPSQMEQVVFNLATNARDAMPRGGALAIALGHVVVESGAIGASERLGAGAYARLTVSDTGSGMDQEALTRAFEPFFTTKPPGEGTGLGLAMVYGIARQSGGDVEIHSEVGRGTTVHVYLPLSDRIEVARPPEPPAMAEPRGGETVLVVEDDDAVLRLVVYAIESRGYRVLVARDASQALELWRQHRDAIDLVVTDVVMPGTSGVELVQTLRAEGHRGPVLFMSGYSAGGLSRLAEMREPLDVLEKPFSPSELTLRVRQALDRRGAPAEPAQPTD